MIAQGHHRNTAACWLGGGHTWRTLLDGTVQPQSRCKQLAAGACCMLAARKGPARCQQVPALQLAAGGRGSRSAADALR